MRFLVALSLAVLLPGALRQARAQASPYLPLDHWSLPYLEQLIRSGVVDDPTPLERPFRRSDARAALARADTARASGAARALVRRLARELDRDPDAAAWVQLSAAAGGLAASHARRTAVRDSGPGDLWHHGYVGGAGAAGPIAFGSRLEWDARLRDDPDYAGAITREVLVPARFREAYASAQLRWAELFFGQMERNLGAPFVEGLMLSDAPYSYDHLVVRLGPPRAHLSLFAAQLEDLPDSTGRPSHRYLALHSLYLRLPLHLTVRLWDGALIAGPDRTFELWFLNPFKLANLTWRDEGGVEVNSFVGGDFALAPPGWPRFFLSLFIDDFPPAAGDDEPTSGALTAGLDAGIRGVGLTAFYTAVANLAYRTTRFDEVVARRGIGLGRNQSDYDQATVIATVLPLPGLLLRPEVTLVRQGEGDFRQPFPPGSAFPDTPVLHQGVVERLLRLGLSGQVSLPLGPAAAHFTFDAGYHDYRNAGHQRGARANRFVGSVGASLRIQWTAVLPER